MSNLTTVSAVKAYLAITTANIDNLISSLIVRESDYVEQWTGRKFPQIARTNKRLNGSGTNRMVLPDSPILSVSSLSIFGRAISASSDGVQSGFVFDETCLYLIGEGTFPIGNQNVTCSWVSGYQTEVTELVPTGNAPTITPNDGGRADSVISLHDDTTSVFLTEVSSSPLANQFSISDGVITFNTSQSNHSVTISYYYVPSPVEQAVIEMVGLDLQQRTNIGISSKSLAGESVSFSQRQMTPSARELLQPFKRMVTA